MSELGHSDRLKNYVESSVQEHSNDLFSETIASMNLKSHMQHDEIKFSLVQKVSELQVMK